MKAAFVSDAEPEAVSHAVRDVLERRGALVSEHLHSRVRFRGLVPRRHSWSREGYVGIYQHTGERDVEVRLLLRARWPYRILLTVATINVLAVLAAAILRPSGTLMFLVAFFAAFALLVAAILYINTLKHVREEERDLMDEFEAELQKDLAGASVLDQEEAEVRALEAELEAEIERRRIAARRRAEAGSGSGGGARRALQMPRFSLRPGRGARAQAPEAQLAVEEASDDELARRREALLARKAELEARRREMERGPP